MNNEIRNYRIRTIFFLFLIKGINIKRFNSIINQKINQEFDENEIIIVIKISHFIKFLKKINKGIIHFWGMNPLALNLAYFIKNLRIFIHF